MNILILGVGQDQLIAIKKAIELKLTIFGLDDNPEAPGFEFCDHSAVCNIKDPDAVEEVALRWNKEFGIDGVIAPAVEVGPSVGRVVDKLGLIGIGEKTAQILTDKAYRYAKLDKLKIPQPHWSLGSLSKYPCVIKPRNESAAVGVKYIETEEELHKEKGMYDLIQEYLEGWEISTEVLVFNNGLYILANADRNYDKKHKWGKALIEDGCQLPSKLPELMKRKINIVVEKVVTGLELKNCAIKLDLLIKDNRVYVLEVAPRLGGGKLSSEMILLAYGIDWWKIAIKIAMGLQLEREELLPKHSKFVAQRYKFPKSPEKVTSHKDRIGDTICEGDTYEEAIENCIKE